MKPVIMLILMAAAFGFFLRTMFIFVRAAGRGVAEPRPRLDQLPARIASVLIYFIGQKKVAEEGPLHHTSKHHLLIFWGFLIIQLGTLEIFVEGLVPSVSMALITPEPLYRLIKIAIDAANLVVLIVIGWALFRRIVVRPRLIPMNLDAGLILGAIASLMITHFLFHGFAIASGLNTHAEGYSPVSTVVAGWLAPWAAGSTATAAQIEQFRPVAQLGMEAAWFLHVGILLVFLNYLPYSKHIHLLGALPNIFTRNLSERRLDMPKLDLEDENQWGVGRYEQFSWKSLIDNYACTECARCTNYCPAYATGKNLSPMQLVHDIRYEMLDRDSLQSERADLAAQAEAFDAHGGEKHPDLVHLESRIAAIDTRLEEMPPMVGGRIAEDTLWACTTCGACQEVCPVFIEHPLKILQMRQNLVLEQEKTPGELGRMFRNVERQSNPWGISSEKRMEWAEGLDVPTIEDKPDPEYILWVGCAGAFDNRIVKQTKAMVKVLNAAGVNYAVLGHSEGCTGDPARRAGNELLFQMQAEANIETLNETGVKKVITSCPHCLHTLRHDYPQFGGNYEVIHHTRLLTSLIEDGKITMGANGAPRSLTYHDSCYLGRWNREFEAPRSILAALPTDEVVELERSRRHGFCCGAGGARMFMEEDEPRVNVNRTDEILATGVEAVAVACPFCNIMITDGMKHRNKDEEVAVLDVAELVAGSIDVPVSALTRKRDSAES